MTEFAFLIELLYCTQHCYISLYCITKQALTLGNGLFPFRLFLLITLRIAMTALTVETKISPYWVQSCSQGRSRVTCAVVLISIMSLIVLSAFQEDNKWVNSPFVMFHHSRSQFCERISTCLDCQSFPSVSKSDRKQSLPRSGSDCRAMRPNYRILHSNPSKFNCTTPLHFFKLQIDCGYSVMKQECYIKSCTTFSRFKHSVQILKANNKLC